MKCPEAVQRYCEKKNLEPLTEPAHLRGSGIELNNVWAIWYEDLNLHVIDSTDDQFQVYCFTAAYPVTESSLNYSGDDCSIQEMKMQYRPMEPK